MNENQKGEVWVDMNNLSEIFYAMDPKSAAAVTYIIRHVNPYTNIVFGTYSEIAKEMNVSRQVASKNIQKLVDQNLVKKIGNGIWFVNPEKYFCGEDADYNEMVRDYAEK